MSLVILIVIVILIAVGLAVAQWIVGPLDPRLIKLVIGLTLLLVVLWMLQAFHVLPAGSLPQLK